jgi:hypothetical protein
MRRVPPARLRGGTCRRRSAGAWATRYKGDILELKRQGGWKDWKQVERYRHGQRPARENLVNPLDLKRTLVNFNRASA